MLLTYGQALELCQEYSYLIGNHITRGWKKISTIEAVVISPYDEFNKYRFIEEYKLTHNVEKSLEFYQEQLFDVLVISRTVLNHELTVCTLRKYLSENLASSKTAVLA